MPSGVHGCLFHWFLGQCFLVEVHPYMICFCTFRQSMHMYSCVASTLLQIVTPYMHMAYTVEHLFLLAAGLEGLQLHVTLVHVFVANLSTGEEHVSHQSGLLLIKPYKCGNPTIADTLGTQYSVRYTVNPSYPPIVETLGTIPYREVSSFRGK